MLQPSMNKLLAQIPNRYLIVNVAAQRAREIQQEAENNEDIILTDKPVTLALREIAEGKLRIIPKPAEDEEEEEMPAL